jgi:hypothetical protein
MSDDLDSVPWLEKVNRLVDQEIASGRPSWAVGPILAAVIRALHEKGVLSTAEKDGLFAAWDRLDEHCRAVDEKQMQALREQYPELARSVLGTSDPP